ncbi:hypothetical protein XELAEV_18024725mg, partial [Xenopus laevis]
MASQRSRRSRCKGAKAHPSPAASRSVSDFLLRPDPPATTWPASPMASQPSLFDSQPTLTQEGEEAARTSDEVLLGKFKLLLQQELDATAAKITSDLTKQVAVLGQRTSDIESKVDDLITVVDSHEQDIVSLQSQVQELQDKIEDSDNRSRRNNIRIRGIPESIADLPQAVTELIQALLPDTPVACMEKDRVHRALHPRRPLRRSFTPNLAEETQHGSYYEDFCRWLFPFRLLFTFHNKQHTISTPEEGLNLLLKLGLLEASSTVSSPAQRSQSKLTPLWEK